MAHHRDAKKELQGYFYDNWVDGLANGLPNSTPVLTAVVFQKRSVTYQPGVYFRNIESVENVPLDEHFAIFTTSDINTTQHSMPGGRANGNGTKYTTPGVGTVQLFFSKNNYSTEEEDFLTAISQEMFLNKSPDNVWTRNPTIMVLPPEEKHFKTNVVFEYEYDTHVFCPSN